jgi:hypothetical protein
VEGTKIVVVKKGNINEQKTKVSRPKDAGPSAEAIGGPTWTFQSTSRHFSFASEEYMGLSCWSCHPPGAIDDVLASQVARVVLHGGSWHFLP